MNISLRMISLSVLLTFSSVIILPMDLPQERSISVLTLPYFFITLDPALKNSLGRTNTEFKRLLSMQNPLMCCKELNANKKDSLKIFFPGVFYNHPITFQILNERYPTFNGKQYESSDHYNGVIEAHLNDFPLLEAGFADDIIAKEIIENENGSFNQPFLAACLLSKTEPIKQIIEKCDSSFVLPWCANSDSLKFLLHVIIFNDHQNGLHQILKVLKSPQEKKHKTKTLGVRKFETNDLLKSIIEELFQLAFYLGRKEIIIDLMPTYQSHIAIGRTQNQVMFKDDFPFVDHIARWLAIENRETTLKSKKIDNLFHVLYEHKTSLLAKHKHNLDNYCDCLKAIKLSEKQIAKLLDQKTENNPKRQSENCVLQ